MKIRYLFILIVFSLACQPDVQNQQVRERNQSLSQQQSQGSSDQEQETDQESTRTINTSSKSSGGIAQEFRVTGGPTSYKSMPVTYGQGASVQHKGFYIRDSDSGTSGPGLLAIHGLAGLTEEFKYNLMRFAARGYRVLAIDLYEGQLPGQDNAAEGLQQSIQARGKTDVLSNITSGVDYLRSELGATTIGVVGWDEGGYWAIETMINFPGSFAALVNYYGTPFELAKNGPNIPIPTLHIFTSNDERQLEEIVNLEKTLNEQSSHSAEFKKYRDVSADFLEPSKKNQDKENIDIAYDHTFTYLDALMKQTSP
ncbi:MAG: dienelactone hydrolase family protein [Oligoflexales bacterium]|nr:dienelactone hydrolase family protein [Oligoflexales bacterium]